MSNKTIFDRTEWDNSMRIYGNITSVVNDSRTSRQHMEAAQQALQEFLRKDPRIVYYDYRFRNPMPDGYYRKRLDQFLSESDSDDEDNSPPNKYLFKIEQEFIKDMKRRFCETEGICWLYINIGCRKIPCDKKHILYQPTQSQIIDYFDLFISKK